MTKSKQFQIYGRTEYETPLTFIKEITVRVSAMTDVSVTDEALAAVGDGDWIELIAVPSNALLHVTGAPTDG